MPLSQSLASPPAGSGGTVWKIALVVAALGVIAVGVWMLLYELGFDESSAGRRSRQSMSFKCDACGHEYSLSPREFSDQAKNQQLDMSKLGLANCPACGAKQVGRPMVQCVGCGKFFVPGSAPLAGGPAHFSCPHCRCEFDLNQLMDASRRRER